MRYIVSLFLLFPCILSGQVLTPNDHRLMQATRTERAPKIDGLIDDTVWNKAASASDFIINAPNFGYPSTLPTQVKILYDDRALYVCAALLDDPKNIRKQLTARDGEQRQDVDFFSIYLDTYNDNQNAFQFVVTSRNVQSDARISASTQRNSGSQTDYGWDAVWESQTKITDKGWTLEMRIPYISLRFSKSPVQSWGINLQRFSRRLNESSYWNSINPNEAGFVNQFGDLTGIQNITPPLRLSLLPYVTTGYRYSPENNSNEFLRNGGMDLKWGINESFTLDATLVPDFGQVVSDNVVLNLSPYEVRFQENRPFFTEGTELFNKAGLFYSRRIGLTPSGYYDVQAQAAADTNLSIIRNPGLTQLINATKFSGRNRNNLGIGVFNAVSAPMYASILNKATGEKTSIQTAPLTNYNLFVIDQALRGRSSITFTNTNVWRNGTARDANVSALDFSLFDKKNKYGVVGTTRYSQISGTENYSGYNTTVSLRKISGHIQFDLTNNIESEKYDPNDLGYLQAPNEFSTSASFSYNQLTPTKRFLSYRYSVNITDRRLYKPLSWQELKLGASAFYFFKNFWDVTFIYESKPLWQIDFFELRTPGRKIRTMPWHYFGFSGSSDSRKKLFIALEGGHGNSPAYPKADYFNYGNTIRYRFNNRLSLELGTEGSFDLGNVGFAFCRETNGDPIAGWRKIREHTSTLSGIYNFTPRMFLTMRARHYWSRVTYEQFFNIDENGYWINRPFIPGNDNNYNAFNLDMFYTWDFAYGSRLIIGWKNRMPSDQLIDGSRYNNYFKNLNQVLTQNQGKEITARLIYFVDYQKLKRKKH